MATKGSDGPGRGSLQDWRHLSQGAKFASLLNHYQTAAHLSDASGIPIKTLRSIFITLQQGKNSRQIDKSEIVEGFRRARRRMTDQMRRELQRAKKGEYKSPLFQTKTNNIRPEVHQLHITTRDHYGRVVTKVMDSFWTSYRVEHLHEDTIFNMARQMFDIFMATDEFNTFRFEYIADAQIYSEGRPYRDEGLYLQAQEHEVIRLSTNAMGFPTFRGDPEFFEEYVRNEWRELQSKGAIRIVDLLWTHMEGLEQVMPLVRRDYQKIKNRYGKRKKGGRGLS